MYDAVQTEKLAVFTHEEQAPHRHQHAAKGQEGVHLT